MLRGMDDLFDDMAPYLDREMLFRPGRSRPPASCEFVRELTEADLPLLEANRGTKPSELRKLTDRHHQLARLTAMGTPGQECAVILGLTASRVSIIQSDPAFKDLVEVYRSQIDAEFGEITNQMAGLSKDVILELRERIEEEPEEFSNGELRNLLATMLDRTGHGPTSTQTNVNVDLGARLQKAQARALEERLARAKDVTPDSESIPGLEAKPGA